MGTKFLSVLDDFKKKEEWKIIYKLVFLSLIVIAQFIGQEFMSNSLLIFPLKIIFYYLALNVLFNTFSYLIVSIYKIKNRSNTNQDLKFILGIKKILFLLNNITFFFVFLYIIGINPYNVLTSISIVAVAMVLIFNQFISNILNGINLMFSKNFNINDLIKIGDVKGRIVNISFQSFELKTDTGEYVFIPNSQIQTKEIINYSIESNKKVKIDFVLEKTIYKNYEKIKTGIIKRLSKEYEGLLDIENPIQIEISKVEKDFATLVVIVRLNKTNLNLDSKIRNSVNEALINSI